MKILCFRTDLSVTPRHVDGVEFIIMDQNPDFVFNGEHVGIFCLTGGTEGALREFYTKNESEFMHRRMLLVFSGSDNSLAATIEVNAYLEQKGVNVKIISHDDITDHLNSDIGNSMKVANRLHGTNFLLIGNPSQWLIASGATTLQDKLIKDKFGTNIIKIDLDELLELYNITAADKTEEAAVKFQELNGFEPTEQNIPFLRLHTAIENLCETHNAEMMSICCFDMIKRIDPSITACLSLSLLNKHMTAGCEGDIQATLSMHIARLVSDMPCFMANPQSVDEESRSLDFAHCTIAPEIPDYAELDTHFETKLNYAVKGYFCPGRKVTIFRLGGMNLERYYLEEGVTIDAGGFRENRCRTQMSVTLYNDTSVDGIFKCPGNHVIIVPDHCANDIRAFCTLYGMQQVN
ncbi:hypothetical protein PCE1_000648 [Barthelona sp. PCE]